MRTLGSAAWADCSYCVVYAADLVRFMFVFFFQAEDGIRDADVTGVQTCALPISLPDWNANQPGATCTIRPSVDTRLLPRSGRQAPRLTESSKNVSWPNMCVRSVARGSD